jgi:trk system potassium uptake protein TrkH
MRPYVILRYLAIVVLFNSIFLLISATISGFTAESSFFPLIYTFLVATLFGLFPLIFIPHPTEIYHKEGLFIVVYSWIVCCLIGVLPYLMWGGEFSFTNAWFESVSGYTTTGSSILTDIEALPLGLLFWRSATHWLGGIGIIIFALAVLPPMGLSGMILYRSEISARALHDFPFNARRSVQILLRVYVGLTLLEILALLISGMSLFDAVTTAFGTIATGGFSVRNASIAYYNSVAVEMVVIVFMILSGIHFGLLFSAVSGKLQNLLRSSIVRFYLLTILIGLSITTLAVLGRDYEDLPSALRYAVFQIVSIATSTGFATADSSVWPPLAQLIIIFFTLQCACAGSTSGGIKIDRVLIFLKSFVLRLRQTLHPKGVYAVKLAGKVVDDSVVTNSLLYISLYIAVVFISALILTSLGVDALSAFSGSAATMGNVGPGLGTVGSTSNFAHFPALGKWVLSLTMLLGRLEIYALIICFLPKGHL